MCGLCGVLGGESDWTATLATSAAAVTRRAERLERVRTINLVLARFGLALADWEGANLLLTSRTGRTEIVDNFAQVWQAAERMGRVCDPLDPTLISSLEQITRVD
jgi:hypothetical protein